MGPYLSLLVLLVPLMLVEPLKVAALFIAGKGHWITGTGVLVWAYIVSLFFVGRLFRVLKPKLLMLPWFAKLWPCFVAVRQKAFALVRTTTLNAANIVASWRNISHEPIRSIQYAMDKVRP
jgi:hypothetical protein